MANAKFRYIDNHAQQDLNLAPGDFIHLSAKQQEEPIVQDLLASGKLIPTGQASERAADEAVSTIAKRDKEGAA